MIRNSTVPRSPSLKKQTSSDAKTWPMKTKSGKAQLAPPYPLLLPCLEAMRRVMIQLACETNRRPRSNGKPIYKGPRMSILSSLSRRSYRLTTVTVKVKVMAKNRLSGVMSVGESILKDGAKQPPIGPLC